MKIDINNAGTKEYYDEFLFLITNQKKIYSNIKKHLMILLIFMIVNVIMILLEYIEVVIL